MSKAFVREDLPEDDDEWLEPSPLPAGVRNYMTPAGHARMKSELLHLLDVERPEVVRTVSWAASNGDRSENGDYIYGKKRLREIDRRVRFLTKRLDAAEIVDRAGAETPEQIFFGATVAFLRNGEHEDTITIVGVDEVDPLRRRVSWISPVARALTKAREGDTVRLQTPAGVDELEVLDVRYDAID